MKKAAANKVLKPLEPAVTAATPAAPPVQDPKRNFFENMIAVLSQMATNPMYTNDERSSARVVRNTLVGELHEVDAAARAEAVRLAQAATTAAPAVSQQQG